MRIAFFVHRFPVISEAFITNAAAGLIDAGHEVDVYALHGDGEATHARHDVVANYRLEQRSRIFRLRDQPRRRLALAPLAGARLAASHGLHAAAALDREAFGEEGPNLVSLHEAALFRHGGRYDILHCQFGTLAQTVLNHRRAGFLSGKVFVHFRGYDISSHVQAHGEDVYDRVFDEADGFFAVCDSLRDRAIALGAPAERMTLAPSGVTVDTFPYKARSWRPDQTLQILAVGRLVEKKGFSYAIDAVSYFAAEGLDVRLTIIGDGPLREALESQAQARGLGERTTFLGAATHEQVAEQLDRAHVFIAPSATAANGDKEGVINTLKEAMAAGCPFVTTDHGGAPELVDGVDAGVMTREGDAEALAEGLLTLLTRRAEWPAMGLRGHRRIVEIYSNEAVTRKIVAAYQRALDRPARHSIRRRNQDAA